MNGSISPPRIHSLRFSHMGFHVTDLEAMAAFYTEGLDFTITDRGALGAVSLVFLSRDPDEHHQIVLASGRPEALPFNPINQISFRVDDLASLRAAQARLLAFGATQVEATTHGNAISIYARDPEGNRLELFMDTPWYCEQPLREPVDLCLPDAVLMAQAESIARQRPHFEPRAVWRERMARRMGLAGTSPSPLASTTP